MKVPMLSTGANTLVIPLMSTRDANASTEANPAWSHSIVRLWAILTLKVFARGWVGSVSGIQGRKRLTLA
jgi:hypothetical protein